MKRDRRIEHASDEDEKESVRSEAFFYADQHDESRVDVQKERKMKEDLSTEHASVSD